MTQDPLHGNALMVRMKPAERMSGPRHLDQCGALSTRILPQREGKGRVGLSTGFRLKHDEWTVEGVLLKKKSRQIIALSLPKIASLPASPIIRHFPPSFFTWLDIALYFRSPYARYDI